MCGSENPEDTKFCKICGSLLKSKNYNEIQFDFNEKIHSETSKQNNVKSNEKSISKVEHKNKSKSNNSSSVEKSAGDAKRTSNSSSVEKTAGNVKKTSNSSSVEKGAGSAKRTSNSSSVEKGAGDAKRTSNSSSVEKSAGSAKRTSNSISVERGAGNTKKISNTKKNNNLVVSKTSFCPNCGTENSIESKFCYECGTSINGRNTNRKSFSNQNYTSNNYTIANDKKRKANNKSSNISLILAFIWPGLGLIYNGLVKRGFVVMLVCIVFVYIDVVIYMLIWLAQLFDSYLTLNAMRKGKKPKLLAIIGLPDGW